MFKGTTVHEPSNCETLYCELSYRNENEMHRTLCIGVLEKDAKGENGTVSFQIVTFPQKGICTVATADLTEYEIDLVINALQDAKERMKGYQ